MAQSFQPEANPTHLIDTPANHGHGRDDPSIDSSSRPDQHHRNGPSFGEHLEKEAVVRVGIRINPARFGLLELRRQRGLEQQGSRSVFRIVGVIRRAKQPQSFAGSEENPKGNRSIANVQCEECHSARLCPMIDPLMEPGNLCLITCKRSPMSPSFPPRSLQLQELLWGGRIVGSIRNAQFEAGVAGEHSTATCILL